MEESMRPRKRVVLVGGIALAVALAGSIAAVVAQGGGLPTADEVFGNKVNENTKADLEQEDALLVAIGEANPAEAPSDPEAAGPPPDPVDFEFEAGVFPDADLPGSAWELTNYWNGELDGWNVTVYAGSLVKDENGMVVVKLTDPLTVGSKFEGPFVAGIPGPLTITSVKGVALTLVGSKGDRVVFDVGLRRFSPA
jgi:hypothetical protein